MAALTTRRVVRMPSHLLRDGAVSWYASVRDADDAVLILLSVGADGAARVPERDDPAQSLYAVTIGELA